MAPPFNQSLYSESWTTSIGQAQFHLGMELGVSSSPGPQELSGGGVIPPRKTRVQTPERGMNIWQCYGVNMCPHLNSNVEALTSSVLFWIWGLWEIIKVR